MVYYSATVAAGRARARVRRLRRPQGQRRQRTEGRDRRQPLSARFRPSYKVAAAQNANALRRWHEIAFNVLRFLLPFPIYPHFYLLPTILWPRRGPFYRHLRGRQPHELPRNREHHRVIWVGACLCSRVPALALILGERCAALSHRARGAPHSVVMHNGAAGDGTVLPPPIVAVLCEVQIVAIVAILKPWQLRANAKALGPEEVEVVMVKVRVPALYWLLEGGLGCLHGRGRNGSNCGSSEGGGEALTKSLFRLLPP